MYMPRGTLLLKGRNWELQVEVRGEAGTGVERWGLGLGGGAWVRGVGCLLIYCETASSSDSLSSAIGRR